MEQEEKQKGNAKVKKEKKSKTGFMFSCSVDNIFFYLFLSLCVYTCGWSPGCNPELGVFAPHTDAK